MPTLFLQLNEYLQVTSDFLEEQLYYSHFMYMSLVNKHPKQPEGFLRTYADIKPTHQECEKQAPSLELRAKNFMRKHVVKETSHIQNHRNIDRQ